MAEFLGMDVRIFLTNGLVVDGRVASIDPRTQLLSLNDAATNINGIRQYFPTYKVPGSDIKDLNILTTSSSQPPIETLPQPVLQQQRPAVQHPVPQPMQPVQYPVQQQYPQASYHPSQNTPPLEPARSFQAAHPPQGHIQQGGIRPPQAEQLPLPPQNLFPQHSMPVLTHSYVPQQQHVPYAPQAVLPNNYPPHPKSASKPFVDPAIIAMSPASTSDVERSGPPQTHRGAKSSQQQQAPLAETSSEQSMKRQEHRKGTSRPAVSKFSGAPSRLPAHDSEYDEEVDYPDYGALGLQGAPVRGSGKSAHVVATSKQATGRHSARQQHNLRQNRFASPGNMRKNKRVPSTTETFGTDASDYAEDFDFEAGLQQFDKRRVFEEISQGDDTAPETRLVSINRLRNVQPGLQGKLGIREMVLDAPFPSGDETGNDTEVDSEEFDSDGAVTIKDGMGVGGVLRLPNRKRMCRTVAGITVPSVTPAEMMEIERVATTETGPSEEQMIENGGRGAAMMILQALGGNRRIKPGNHNDGPFVVVLVGNNKTGAFGLCAARHLANHECNVLVCAVGGDAELVNLVATQQKIYLPTGGRLTRGLVDLPSTAQPIDLIVDALLGPSQNLLELNEGDRRLVCDLIGWANSNKANILSVDLASGVNGSSGQPVSPTHYVQPKWTLALGLPKIGLIRAAKESRGEIFLADLGIPRVVFLKVNKGKGKGVRYTPPFGDKFLVGLEVVEVEAAAV
ncbi:enhancer of mRNA decapping [Gaertneriomyces sp. JEL0708]|nr:enhancer of mRNA decapping [Gaertneriomyces sp. JEL0708]